MKEFLIEFWYLAAGAAVSVGVSAIALQYYFRKADSVVVFISNILVFIALAAWLGSYALATRLEIESIDLSFPDEILTGPDISAAFHAIGLAIGFGLLLVFHRYPLVVIILIFGVAIGDWSGNSLLIQSMQEFASEQNGFHNLLPGQKIWYVYYVFGDHLSRISIYVAIGFMALFIFMLSCIGYIKVDALESNFGRSFASALRKASSWRIFFGSVARICIVSAILINGYWIWNIRLDREASLSCYERSFFYQWSLQRVKAKVDCGLVTAEFGEYIKK